MKAIAVIALLLLTGCRLEYRFESKPTEPPPDIGRPAVNPGEEEEFNLAKELLHYHNQFRRESDVPQLRMQGHLNLAAQRHAKWMADRAKCTHVGDDESSVADRVIGAGMTFKAAGENIAVGYADHIEVMGAWLNSPTHRAVMLDEKYQAAGFASAAGVDGKTYWCAVFAKPTELGEGMTRFPQIAQSGPLVEETK